MKVFLSTAAIVLALGLSACGGDDKSTASEQATQSESSSSITEQRADSVFLTVVRNEIDWLLWVPDAEVIALGHSVCDAFDNGVSAAQLADAGADAGVTYYEQGYIIGAATQSYCPRHSSTLR